MYSYNGYNTYNSLYNEHIKYNKSYRNFTPAFSPLNNTSSTNIFNDDNKIINLKTNRENISLDNDTKKDLEEEEEKENINNNQNETKAKENNSNKRIDEKEDAPNYRIGPLSIYNDKIDILGFSFAIDDLIIIGLMLIIFLDSDSDFVLLIVLGLMLFNISFSSLNLF